MSTSKADTWQKYMEYLAEWAIDHLQMKFYGMSPASFDEWYDNEYGEEAEDAEEKE